VHCTLVFGEEVSRTKEEDEVSEDIEDEPRTGEWQKYDYEEPSLIDLEDLESVSGGQTLICITGGSAEIWPKTDWNDY
jgi:hypothetical protein